MHEQKDMSRHPCFNKKESGSCGRAHLPVAPKCNVSCNFCNRKYDCVNESRPGVTSAVLAPPQAVQYMAKVLEREPRITVAGIAGPGDPMANPDETIGTMRLLKKRFPQLLFCLSTNGLALPEHLDGLASAGVSHVTVTVNAVDAAIGAKIYAFVREGNVIYRGEQAARLLLTHQLAGIRGLKERGMMVKVNTIVLPGVNDGHITEIARMAGEMDVDLMNLIPVHPTAGTPFAELARPSRDLMRELRLQADKHVVQMTHCRRCRADAVGMLCKDLSGEMSGDLRACSRNEPASKEPKPYVAVATREGMLVNRHLGEAEVLHVFEQAGDGFRLVEERKTPPPGYGPGRWEQLAANFADCRAVVVQAMGEAPHRALSGCGITPVVGAGLIEEALEVVYSGGDVETLRGRRGGVAGSCTGEGKGCG